MIVIANREADFQTSTDRKVIPIHELFKGFPPKIEIKDIYFVDDSTEAEYLLILRTTEDSPEHLDNFYLEVSENGSSVPARYFDVDIHELEIEVIPMSLTSNTIPWIRIKFDQLA